MLANKLTSISLVLLLFSCKTPQNVYLKGEGNSRVRHGRWTEEYSSNQGNLVAKGKYNHGMKVGTWKTTFQGKLYERDRINRNITKTNRFHPNGKLMEKGQSRLDATQHESHWYYFGDWKYYNDQEKIMYTKKYTDDKKVDSISYLK